ncbi:glucokinase [Roseicella aerolata]|uniref:Glucokinase n=1 Tax=Roseicella aerolata TaxID=2883479 RepID=A0A9X1L5W7_9PROT|nr:glucokinase [Roseicella aerolata]MCB4820136.1 glucokinase [Roseicella aerolata]
MTMLLADIGGTNARFALLEGESYTPPVNLPLSGFTGIIAAIADFLGGRPPPAAAVLAVAGPVQQNRVTLTNRDWVVDGAEIAAALGIGRVRVVNDFAAFSWSLPHLSGADLHPLGGGTGAPGEPMAVLGPGTGLGVGAFLPPDRVLVTEGGHASLAAHDAREAAVVEWLRARHGHVSAERLLSGQGIENIHAALSALDDVATEPLEAATITARGLSGECRTCREALEMFCAQLGSVAGDLALLYGARGGVYVAGGICPRFPEFLAASRFRARFEAKGRFRDWLAPIPAHLIMRPDAAMLGLAALARQG